MKKYVKPELIYESFELSQQIAACDYDMDPAHPSQDRNCVFIAEWDPGVKIFSAGSACTTPTEV